MSNLLASWLLSSSCTKSRACFTALHLDLTSSTVVGSRASLTLVMAALILCAIVPYVST